MDRVSLVSYNSLVSAPTKSMIDRVVGGPQLAANADAVSLLKNDFNNKKRKILATLRNIDELKTGLVRLQVFHNLLECLDVEVNDQDLNHLKKRFGVAYQGDSFIKYDSVLKSLRYDNHREKWFIARVHDDDPLLNEKRAQELKMRSSLEYENRESNTNHRGPQSRMLSHVNLQQFKED